MNYITRFAATFGLAAVLGGSVSLVPAQAQDFHVRYDIADVRRDERRLDDLILQRHREADRHDWRDVERLDHQIADLRRHIDLDRRDIHADVRHDDHVYRDHDRDRYHDGDDYRWRDR